jgi:hypothetical protein
VHQEVVVRDVPRTVVPAAAVVCSAEVATGADSFDSTRTGSAANAVTGNDHRAAGSSLSIESSPPRGET